MRDGYYVKPQLTLKGLKVLNEPAGEAQLQNMGPFGGEKWTDDQQLWWTGAIPAINSYWRCRSPATANKS